MIDIYNGCILKIRATYFKEETGKFVFLSQDNEVPSARIHPSGDRLRPDDCTLGSVTKIRDHHSVDGAPGHGTFGEIPREAQDLFLLTDSFDFRKQLIIERIGPPTESAGRLTQ